MKKNPVLVLTGLAVAAVAVVAGLTKDKWLDGAPQIVSALAVNQAPEQNAVAETQAVTPTEQPVEQAAATGSEQPAATAEPPAPEQPAEAPAASQTPAESQPETPVEQTVAPSEPQAPAAEQQTATPAQSESPETTPAEQQVAAAQDPATPDEPMAPETKSDVVAPPAARVVPSFDLVRVEKTGEAVIAGTAEAGAEVTVKLDGVEVGKTVANRDGAFVVIPENPLPEGTGALSIEALAEGDIAPTSSEQVVAVIVPARASKQDALVAIVSPGEPTRVLQRPEPDAQAEQQVASVQPEGAAPAEQAAPKPLEGKIKQLSLDAVDYDESGNIVFTGRGEPGHGARIYVDNGHVGDAIAGEDGRWLFSGTADIAIGVHTLRIDGIDAAGKVQTRIEVPFFREESRKLADTTQAPAEPETKTDLQQTAAAEPAAEPEVATPDKPKKGRVVIQPGNNLWRIAKVLYGDGRKYTMLYEANKDQIRDPDRIYPGQIFATPDVVPPGETIDPHMRDPVMPQEGAAGAQ